MYVIYVYTHMLYMYITFIDVYINGKTRWTLLIHHGQSAEPVDAKINEGCFVKEDRKIKEILEDWVVIVHSFNHST